MKLTQGIALMTMSVASSISAAQPNANTAAITSIVESVGTLADMGNYSALEKLFADEVLIDYSSLSGEAATIKSPQRLMTEWASILPGFDRTRHSLSNIKPTFNDKKLAKKASAVANVTAGHWIGPLYWEVSGRYDYRFERDANDWKITSLKLTVTGETGTRDVFAKAAAATVANPNDYITRLQTQQAVLDFLTGLEDKDMHRVNNIWAEDAVQDMPYAPEGFPKRVVGKKALIAQYSGWPQNAGEANFTDALVFYPTADPQTLVVEYHGISEIIPTNRRYDQKYIGVFHVVNKKIQLFREYFDPNVFAYAFKLNNGGSFSAKE